MTHMTVGDLEPNFKVLHYLFKFCSPILPLRIYDVGTGRLTALTSWPRIITCFIAHIGAFVYVYVLSLNMYHTFPAWEEAKSWATWTPFFWEKPLLVFYVFTYLFMFCAYSHLMLTLPTSVNQWNEAVENFGRLAQVQGGSRENQWIIESYQINLKAWGSIFVPIMASTLFFHPLLYARFNDHPFTLLRYFEHESRTTPVTFCCLAVDSAVHTFFMTNLAFYIHFCLLFYLDEHIAETLTNQELASFQDSQMEELKAQMGEDAGKIIYRKDKYSYY